MDSSTENLLNIKLCTNQEFKLILDDISPKKVFSEGFALNEELISKLELVSEDRERLKKELKDLQAERIGLIQDIAKRKLIHEEISAYFAKINARVLREMELEAKVLTEIYNRKSNLLTKMRGLLHQSPIKESNAYNRSRKRSLDFEGIPLRKLVIRESLSPEKKTNTTRRIKVAAFRNSLCN